MWKTFLARCWSPISASLKIYMRQVAGQTMLGCDGWAGIRRCVKATNVFLDRNGDGGEVKGKTLGFFLKIFKRGKFSGRVFVILYYPL